MLKKKKKKSLFSIDSVEVINDLVVFAVSCFFVSKKQQKSGFSCVREVLPGSGCRCKVQVAELQGKKLKREKKKK